MSFSLQARIAEKQESTLSQAEQSAKSFHGYNTQCNNNENVSEFQARVIGSIENLYNTGKITRSEYAAMYAEYSEIIRNMGR